MPGGGGGGRKLGGGGPLSTTVWPVFVSVIEDATTSDTEGERYPCTTTVSPIRTALASCVVR
jgi:hypothetical protein